MHIILITLFTLSGATYSWVNDDISCSPNGVKIAYDNHPQQFFECVNNKLLLKSCLNGYIFNPNTGFCTLEESTTRIPEVCKNNETKPYLFDNTKYYKCYNGQWMLMKCSKGDIFKSGKCEPLVTTTTTVIPTTNNYCVPIAFKPNPSDCRTYYQCDNGRWVLRQCGPGTAWDQLNLTCNFAYLICPATEFNKPDEHNVNSF